MNGEADRYTLDDLFSDYKGRFVGFARRYVRDEATAEDIVMDAFTQYWSKKDSLHPDSNIPAWILTVIKHKCLNHLEHQKTCRDAAEDIRRQAMWEMQTRIVSLRAYDPEAVFSREAQQIVDDTLGSLPERTRRSFIMSRHENRANGEIASHLGISVKGVEYHISKTLKALRKNLKDFYALL